MSHLYKSVHSAPHNSLRPTYSSVSPIIRTHPISILKSTAIFAKKSLHKGDKEMFLHRLNSATRRLVVIAFAGVLSVSGWAQDMQPAAQSGPPQSALPQAPQPMPARVPQSQHYASVDYSKPRSQFPNVIAPYRPGYVPPPNLSNTDRIQQLMHDG